VSVCIPARNAAAFIAETIESVLRQDHRDFELLVCDNASMDATPHVCGRYVGAGLEYHRFEEVVGQAGNWNRCLALARGTYTILLHADDLLEPGFLSYAVARLESEPRVSFVHCAVRLIDGSGADLGTRRLYPDDTTIAGQEFFRRLATEGCLVNPAGVLVRAEALRRAGRFSEQVRWGIDWHMWLRLSLQGNVGYVSQPLARYRQHAESGTAEVLASGRLAADELWVVRDTIAASNLGPAEAVTLLQAARRGVGHRVWCQAEQALIDHKRTPARRGLADAVRCDPRLLATTRWWGVASGVLLGPSWYRRLLAVRSA
jgi:glycosyltransferase involved in cell wall biosynthesis